MRCGFQFTLKLSTHIHTHTRFDSNALSHSLIYSICLFLFVIRLFSPLIFCFFFSLRNNRIYIIARPQRQILDPSLFVNFSVRQLICVVLLRSLLRWKRKMFADYSILLRWMNGDTTRLFRDLVGFYFYWVTLILFLSGWESLCVCSVRFIFISRYSDQIPILYANLYIFDRHAWARNNYVTARIFSKWNKSNKCARRFQHKSERKTEYNVCGELNEILTANTKSQPSFTNTRSFVRWLSFTLLTVCFFKRA